MSYSYIRWIALLGFSDPTLPYQVVTAEHDSLCVIQQHQCLVSHIYYDHGLSIYLHPPEWPTVGEVLHRSTELSVYISTHQNLYHSYKSKLQRGVTFGSAHARMERSSAGRFSNPFGRGPTFLVILAKYFGHVRYTLLFIIITPNAYLRVVELCWCWVASNGDNIVPLQQSYISPSKLTRCSKFGLSFMAEGTTFVAGNASIRYPSLPSRLSCSLQSSTKLAHSFRFHSSSPFISIKITYV